MFSSMFGWLASMATGKYERIVSNEEQNLMFSVWERGYPKRFSMHELTVWKKDVQKYDQYVRKILAIKEENDIPDELWSELKEGHVDVKPYLLAIYGDDNIEYEKMRDEMVEKAFDFFIKKYMKLHEIKEYNAARHIIDDIVSSEMSYEMSEERKKKIHPLKPSMMVQR